MASFGFDDARGALGFLGIEEARWPGLLERVRDEQRKQGWHVVSGGAAA